MAAKLCIVCNKRRPQTGSKGLETSPHNDQCNYCFEEAGYENQHSDSGHDAILDSLEDVEYGKTTHKTEAEYLAWKASQEQEIEGCWICFPHLNLAQKPGKAATTTAKVQSTRRPQFNHKGHSHPQTPAARRACKVAFWASLTPVANVSTNDQIAAAMAKWNFKCDGFGKTEFVKVPGTNVVASKNGTIKPATWNVASEPGLVEGVQATVNKINKSAEKALAKKAKVIK